MTTTSIGSNPNRIESINVFKDKDALEKYGEKGKLGVIVIKSKEVKDGTMEIKWKDGDKARTDSVRAKVFVNGAEQ